MKVGGCLSVVLLLFCEAFFFFFLVGWLCFASFVLVVWFFAFIVWIQIE